MLYYIVIDAWYYVVGYFDDEKEATETACKRGGYVVPMKHRRTTYGEIKQQKKPAA